MIAGGNAAEGGDGSAVQEQLTNVKQIQACGGAFAGILCDGSVVIWGAMGKGRGKGNGKGKEQGKGKGKRKEKGKGNGYGSS